jgi:type I restriction enzyme S subunit
MVPEGWKLVTIGDLTSYHSYGPRFSAKDYHVDGTVKTIRNTDVTEIGEILYEQVPSAQLDSEIVEQHKLKAGDLIIITTVDCGLSAIFEGQDIAYIPSAYAVRHRLNQTVLPTFIKYFMHTSIAQKQVGKFIRKGTVANLPGLDV